MRARACARASIATTALCDVSVPARSAWADAHVFLHSQAFNPKCTCLVTIFRRHEHCDPRATRATARDLPHAVHTCKLLS
eukprot:12698155-Alexandrium_andersonii.AAC.1